MNQLKVNILIDNRLSKDKKQQALECEHGFSLYFEADERRWLYDVGASKIFQSNAKHLGISLSNIDFLLLSHGHNDHTGGLPEFWIKNSTGTVMASDKILKYKYFSSRHNPKKNIGIDEKTLKGNIRFLGKHNNQWITQNVAIVFPKSRKHMLPIGDQFLSVSDNAGERPDNFDHEMVIAIKTTKGLVILSACSHNGILNIIDDCRTFTQCHQIAAFIGGTHLIDDAESDEELAIIADEIQQHYPTMRLITGHCTGNKAAEVLSQKLGDNFTMFYCGWKESFPM